MNHQSGKTPAECAFCQQHKPDPIGIWAHRHLQAQQALLWEAAVEAFGPEPFKELDSRGNCDCGSGFNGLIVAIRSRMEKQDA